jgi:hypothetical protein
MLRTAANRQAARPWQVLEHGTSADRQLAVYQCTGDLRAVVDPLI